MSTLRVNTIQNAAGTGNASPTPIGVGQTWQNVLGSRAINTDYVNSTGRPIMVGIQVRSNGTASECQLQVGGVTVAAYFFSLTSGSTSNGTTLTAVIPAGATYRLNQTSLITLSSWAELR